MQDRSKYVVLFNIKPYTIIVQIHKKLDLCCKIINMVL